MKRRPGYTLIELLVATASASVLMVGLSSALFVASRALNLDEGAIPVRNHADMALSRLMADLREARLFNQLLAEEVEFTVPDRDGDGVDETLHYVWSGTAGDPLFRSVNGGTSHEVLKNVRSLNFESYTRSVSAVDVAVVPPPPWPIVESISSVLVDPEINQLVLPAPTGVTEGDLLLACVAVHNVDMNSFIPPTGWMLLDLNEEANHVTFGLWWKIASASEPASYDWRWTGDDLAAGVGLRVSNQYAGNPFTAVAPTIGKSETPECLSTSTTLDNSMVLRIGGFHKDEIETVGITGLPSHTDLYMNATSEIGIGVGYRVQGSAGLTGTANFELTASKEYRTVTLVIAPNQSP